MVRWGLASCNQIHIPSLLITNRVTLDKSFNLSVPYL